MTQAKILVTAAAGKTGMQTTLRLLEKGYPVRAFVHQSDSRSDLLKRAGADILIGSMENWGDLKASLHGVQRAYFCPPLEPGTLRRAALFAAAAEAAKLEVVVELSQWLVDPSHPAMHAREKWLSHKMFLWNRSFDIVCVNPGWFADNYMAALETIAQFGLMALPLGNGLNAPPSNEDIAAVIVGALTNPAPHIGKTYRPTGPQLLDPNEIAFIFGKVLDRKVRYQDAPLNLFLKVAKSLRLSDFLILQLYWFLQEYQKNSFGIGAPTNAVFEVSGVQPENFEHIVRRYVAASPISKRSVANTSRAAVNLIRALITPSPNLNLIARNLGFPDKMEPALFAVESEEWRSEHI